MAKSTGVFWLPGNPEGRQSGTLRIDQSGSELRVQGELTAGWREVSRTPTEDGNFVVESVPNDDDIEKLTVHGMRAKSPRQVTLIECLTTNRVGISLTRHGFSEQVLNSRYTILGAHVSGADQKYRSVRVRVANLDEWAHLPGLSVESSTQRIEETIRLAPSESPSAQIRDGVTLTLSTSGRTRINSNRRASLHRYTWLEFTGFEPDTMDAIERAYVTPMVTYLTIASGVPCPLESVELQPDRGEGELSEWVRLHHSNLSRKSRGIPTHRMLLSFGDVTLENIAEFLEVNKSIGSLTPVLADASQSLQKSSMETQILELTTVAEGMHRILYPDQFRMSREDADRARALLMASVEGEAAEVTAVVRGLLRHLEEPNYKSRLRALTQECEAAIKEVTGDQQKWIKAVDVARNSYAHRLADDLDGSSVLRYYVLCRSLTWLMSTLILLRSGLQASDIAQRLTRYLSYQHFLREAHAYYPEIYSSDDE